MRTEDNVTRIGQEELVALKKYQNLSDANLLKELEAWHREVSRIEHADSFEQLASEQAFLMRAVKEVDLITSYIRAARKHLEKEI